MVNLSATYKVEGEEGGSFAMNMIQSLMVLCTVKKETVRVC